MTKQEMPDSRWYLAEMIIRKYETSSVDWNGVFTGGRSIRIQQEDYDKVVESVESGRERLVCEALELKKRGLVEIKNKDWIIYGSDLQQVHYRLEHMPDFYEMTGIVPKYVQVGELLSELEQRIALVKKEWIQRYLESLAVMLRKGKIPPVLAGDVEKRKKYLDCYCGLDQLTEPGFKRVFSIRFLGGSKIFEKELQQSVINTAREYHVDIVEDMTDTQVLSQIYLEEYSQELTVKGPLRIILDGTLIDLSTFTYGAVLNSEMLKHAQIAPDQTIHTVITIENKANFMSAEYKADTLYIFSHGYFSPRERQFLQEMNHILEKQNIRFYHSGDLDYGGLCIYRYIKERIFPGLRPYNMDVDIYEKYLKYGDKIEDSTYQKLERLGDKLPEELQPLYREMLKYRMGIEQESFL